MKIRSWSNETDDLKLFMWQLWSLSQSVALILRCLLTGTGPEKKGQKWLCAFFEYLYNSAGFKL